MNDEIETECQKCHHMIAKSEAMPDPETDKGEFCYECYANMNDMLEIKKHGARILTYFRRPVAGEEWIEKFYGCRGSVLDKKLRGNCHPSAREVVVYLNRALPPGAGAKLVRGKFGLSQHSWVVVWMDDWEIILDPTQFQFIEGQAPAFEFVDIYDSRYDAHDYRTNLASYRAVPKHISSQSKKFKASNPVLSIMHKILGRKNSGPNAGRFWIGEILFIAHQPPYMFDRLQVDVYNSLVANKYGAFIPNEAKIASGLIPDPDADVNTRKKS